jgi:hypothetical protein
MKLEERRTIDGAGRKVRGRGRRGEDGRGELDKRLRG